MVVFVMCSACEGCGMRTDTPRPIPYAWIPDKLITGTPDAERFSELMGLEGCPERIRVVHCSWCSGNGSFAVSRLKEALADAD